MDSHAVWTGLDTKRGEVPPGVGGKSDANVAGNDLDAAIAINALNQALANARAVALRCEHQYFAALRIHSPDLAVAALDHANEAQIHADRISERLAELGGTPAAMADAAPSGAHPEYRADNSIANVVGTCLAAQRAAIISYRDVATSLIPSDVATKDLIDDILSSEERRAAALAALLTRVSNPPKC